MSDLVSYLFSEKKVESVGVLLLAAISWMAWDTRERVGELQTIQAVTGAQVKANGTAIEALRRNRTTDRASRDRELDAIQEELREMRRRQD